MVKPTRYGANDLEAVTEPDLDGGFVRTHNQVELHAAVTMRFGRFDGMIDKAYLLFRCPLDFGVDKVGRIYYMLAVAGLVGF